jgi:hypothetical protein
VQIQQPCKKQEHAASSAQYVKAERINATASSEPRAKRSTHPHDRTERKFASSRAGIAPRTEGKQDTLNNTSSDSRQQARSDTKTCNKISVKLLAAFEQPLDHTPTLLAETTASQHHAVSASKLRDEH